MPTTTLSPNEIVARGKALYERDLCSLLGTAANRGKLLMIDVGSGDFEMGADGDDVAILDRLLARRPDAAVYSMKIGYRTPDAIGRSLEETA